jgi:hypothetical protein
MDTRMNHKAAPAGAGVLSLSASGQQIVRIQAFKVVRLDRPSAVKVGGSCGHCALHPGRMTWLSSIDKRKRGILRLAAP